MITHSFNTGKSARTAWDQACYAVRMNWSSYWLRKMLPYIKMLFEAMRWVNKETHKEEDDSHKLSFDLHLHCGIHTHTHTHTQKRCVNFQPNLQHREGDRQTSS